MERKRGPTGAYCAMALCSNSFKYRDKDPHNPLSFHKFPRDPAIRKLWVYLCKRQDKFNVDNSSLCSAHFTSEDFRRDLQSELLNLRPKRKLLPGTVPSQNIPNDPKSDSAVRRCQRIEERRSLLGPSEINAPSCSGEESLIGEPTKNLDLRKNLSDNPLSTAVDILAEFGLLQEDDDFIFSQYIYREMKYLSSRIKKDLKRDIQQALFRAMEHNLENQD